MTTRRIDVFTHVLPRPYLDVLERQAGGLPASLAGILRARTCLYDLDLRRRVMERFEGYSQVLTLSVPPPEAFGGPALARDLARAANDAMAEIVNRHPQEFVGFAASLPMNDVDAALDEADRSVGTLGALGVQICTNVNGVPLDDPRFEPFFARIAERSLPLWVHPYRTAELPDYASEASSRLGMWMAFGWPYETTVFVSRLVLAGHFDRYPDLRLITHHGGGMLPFFAHRVGAGVGAEIPPVAAPGEAPPTDQAALQIRIIERYRRIYADTAVAGTRHAIEAALSFFGPDHLLFATDMPFDPENGPGWIRDTTAALDSMDLGPDERSRIYGGNAQRLLRLPT